MSTPSISPKIKPGIFSEAVKHYWKIVSKGNSGIRSGMQMNVFASTIGNLLNEMKYPVQIYTTRGGTTIPGYYRPTKEWDMIVIYEDVLIAIIEFKSMVGSYGNNLNNRLEEALGSATDFWTAYNKGIFVKNTAKEIRPWLGYLFMLGWRNEKEHDKAKKPLQKSKVMNFNIRDIFCDVSSIERLENGFKQFINKDDQKYNSACIITADKRKCKTKINYSEPADDFTAEKFLFELLTHVSISMKKLGISP